MGNYEYPYVAGFARGKKGKKRIRRVSTQLARERAKDQGLRGPQAGAFIKEDRSATMQGLGGAQFKDYAERPGAHRQAMKKAMKQARRELKRRRTT
jgi:hypothetical protein